MFTRVPGLHWPALAPFFPRGDNQKCLRTKAPWLQLMTTTRHQVSALPPAALAKTRVQAGAQARDGYRLNHWDGPNASGAHGQCSHGLFCRLDAATPFALCWLPLWVVSFLLHALCLQPCWLPGRWTTAGLTAPVMMPPAPWRQPCGQASSLRFSP